MSERTVVTIDRDVCIGSGMCVMYAPESFAQDDEAKSMLIDPPGDPIDVIREAVDACPTRALRMGSDETGS